jgi:hypothetical protein
LYFERFWKAGVPRLIGRVWIEKQVLAQTSADRIGDQRRITAEVIAATFVI